MPRPLSPQNAKKELLFNSIRTQYLQAFSKGDLDRALKLMTDCHRLAPHVSVPWGDAAIVCILLRRWAEAVEFAERALKLAGSPSLALYHSLAHAHGEAGNSAAAQHYGKIAISEGRRLCSGPSVPHQMHEMPPEPSATTRAHNIIAFSLFGAQPGYCETAILNAAERTRVYPNWTCHFFVDDTVPVHVLNRLADHGAEIHVVSDEDRRLPGTMWRFMALDVPNAHRVIFRDADSLICDREADAVDEWIASRLHFHHMRDFWSHTDVMLAGMWGCIVGALPPMRPALHRFMATVSERDRRERTIDQVFLRSIWSTARHSLMQHDSVFGIDGSYPFRIDRPAVDWHVGSAYGRVPKRIGFTSSKGSVIVWSLTDAGDTLVAGLYRSTSIGDAFDVEIPLNFFEALRAGTLSIRCAVERAA